MKNIYKLYSIGSPWTLWFTISATWKTFGFGIEFSWYSSKPFLFIKIGVITFGIGFVFGTRKK